MELMGTLIKRAFELRNIPNKIKDQRRNRENEQKRVLLRLITFAQYTHIGKEFHFTKLLNRKHRISNFQNSVPIFDYKTIYAKYWYRLLQGESYITWPRKVKYFAMSSGTSEASSKYIPVTGNMLRSIKKASIRQLVSMVNYNFPLEFYHKGILMIGGSTHLNYNGKYYAGDLSGITANKLPFWFQHWYKPGKNISKLSDWDQKLQEIVDSAPNWDIGVIVGVPAWVQIIIEKIIDHYQLKSIHDLWPNLKIYVHSGVSIKPYQRSFNKLFGEKVFYIESYLASEGYIAFKTKPEAQGMELITNNGIFYEFVPFNTDNFDENGDLKENAKAIWLKDVEENTEYALLLTTNAGTWRYLIGDTIIFTNKKNAEIQITGRTKQFLSVCGEHLSLDNVSQAIELVQHQLNINIAEFTLMAEPYELLFGHHWYIGTDDVANADEIQQIIDKVLSEINDDYRVERLEAIRNVKVDILPTKVFYDFMASKGKMGSANKFPRILKGDRIDEWKSFVEKQNL